MHCFVEIVIPVDSGYGLTGPTEHDIWEPTPRGMEICFYEDPEAALSWLKLFLTDHPEAVFRIAHITYLDTAEIFSNDLTGKFFPEAFGFLDSDMICYKPSWEEALQYINEGNRLLGLPETEMLEPDDSAFCPKIPVQRVISANDITFRFPIGWSTTTKMSNQ